MFVFVIFLSSFLPHSPLFGSAAALEDAWHLSIICTQEDHTKGRWVQQRVDRQMSKKRNEYAGMFVLDIAATGQTFHESRNDQMCSAQLYHDNQRYTVYMYTIYKKKMHKAHMPEWYRQWH